MVGFFFSDSFWSFFFFFGVSSGSGLRYKKDLQKGMFSSSVWKLWQDEVLAKITPKAIIVEDADLAKVSKPKKKTSRSKGPSSTSSLKRKASISSTQEVGKPEPEETPKKKKKLQKLSEKKTPTGKLAAIAGRTRSSSSPDQVKSKKTIHHAESTPTKEVKKGKTKTAPTKETQEEEVKKVELKKSPSLASSDSSPASLEATSEGPQTNPEHEASSQTPDKSKLSPFKPEPPTVQKDEIVEEAADEDMEDLFKAAASLVQLGGQFPLIRPEQNSKIGIQALMPESGHQVRKEAVSLYIPFIFKLAVGEGPSKREVFFLDLEVLAGSTSSTIIAPGVTFAKTSSRFGKWWVEHVSKYFAKDLDEVLAKVTPGALVVEDVDPTKTSKSKKKTSRFEGLSPSASLKRKGAQEVIKPEPEETPQKKRLKKLSEKKPSAGKTTAIAGRTRSSTKASSPNQAKSKETAHHAESTPKKEVKKTKTKTARPKQSHEKEVQKAKLKKSPSIASSDSSTASLETTSEGPPINPEHELHLKRLRNPRSHHSSLILQPSKR
ncbi:hypothetical protein RHGRI_013910 [Rhododendron griersonianum]|uniref:Uncharacterized protein n=1 Tax=Rhododendron griersonianum TaxID=479676 RepID=A0AAV6K7D9_9ERIC|nr:hypothetical protein RHGRI_013910 [Rhododendron griersonianum]